MKPVASCRLVLATAIACLLSTAGQAQAKVIAYSSLQIINFTVVSGAEVLDLSSLNGVNITAGNVSLRGTSASDAFPMNDGDSDVPLVCIGDCAGIAQNDFSSVAMANPGRDFARADASLSGSIVRPLGFDNRTVAEAQLLTAGTASAEGVGQSILNMTTIDFTSGQSGELALTFEALGELSVHSDEAAGAAMADFDLDIQVFDLTNGGLLSFSVTSLNGRTSLEDLSASISALGAEQFDFLVNDTFSLTLAGLLPENDYRLLIFQDASISASSAQAPPPVPEPFTVSLLGAGVAGLAAYRRKRLR